MSTLKTTNIAHPSSASNNIVLDSAGGVDLDALTVSGSAPADSVNIDASGRLLVGTSSARSNTFNGVTQGGALQVELSGGGSQPQAVFGLYSGGTTQFPGPVSIYGATRATTVGGNTIVAQNDRIALLSFQGNDGSEFVESASISAWVDGTPGANDMPGRLVFSTTADGASSPTERMRITNAGEVLIATSTPVLNTYGLTVGVTAAFASGLRLQDGGGVGWSGNPTIRNNNASGYLICMNGTTGGVGLANGGGSWVSISDENYKTNLEPITEASAKVRSLRSVTGRYIDDDETISRSFLIAQDVEAVLPEAVSTAENGKKLLSYTDTIPLLTAALKEALEKIEILEARLTAAGIS